MESIKIRFEFPGKAIITLGIIVLLSNFIPASQVWADEQLLAKMKEIERKTDSYVLIEETVITIPLNRFLLIRQGDRCCAMKFASAHVTGDYRKEDWHQYAEYDWYYNNREGNNSVGSWISSGHGNLDAGAPKQFWRFISRFGNTMLECGNIELEWVLPTGISLTKGFTGKGNGIKVSPTRWENVSDINFAEPSLVWYEYKSIYDYPKLQEIHIDNLPPLDK